MPNLFNEKLSRKELLKRIGNTDQVFGTRKMIISQGLGKGTEIIEVKNGRGICFTVVPDRGMDILWASYKSIPLCWISKNSIVANQYYNEKGLGWLRSFSGGLLTTCGLCSAGSPSIDEGKEYGLHGRISNIPATHVSIDESWQNDEYNITILGTVREANTFGENLVLKRKITTGTKENCIIIEDEIINEGFKSEPLMLLYHFNYGYPLITNKTEIILPKAQTTVRGDDQSQKNEWKHFNNPTSNLKEVVYYHDITADKKNTCFYQLNNKNLGIGVKLEWNKKELKNLIQWKMCGEGEYVLGMEPSNCKLAGRQTEKQKGNVEMLESFSKKRTKLKLSILDI